jgi:hypothetical protein
LTILNKPVKKKVVKVNWVLDPETLAKLKACPECRENPAVFLTSKKVPCCRLCWDKLADGLDVSAIAVDVPNCQLPDRVNLDFDESSLEAA